MTPGDFLTRIHFDHESPDTPYRLEILRADPVILITAELLVHLDGSPWAQLDGDVLRLRDDFGHRYVYRLGELDPVLQAYPAAWPD